MSYQQYERMEVIKMLDHVGKMVNKLRKEKGVAQADLARGILDIGEYSRFESGGRELDKMHLEAFFQRLGKSEDKLELAVSMEEYQIQAISYTILQLLAEGKVKETDKKIVEYQNYADMQRPLYRQAVRQMKALRDYTENKNREKVIPALEQALEETFPDWRNTELKQVCLCTQEIQILLLLVYFQAGDEKMQVILQKLFFYIDQRYTDGEERVRVYPQCAWLLGRVYLAKKNIGSASEVCEKGVECLVENGSLALMKELLELKEECMKLLGKNDGNVRMESQKDAIDFLYELTGVTYVEEKSILILQTSRETEAIILNEVLKEMRQAKGLTQVELSEDICSAETLSRIESGGRKPNRKKAYAMLQRMGYGREKYYGSIVADDYGLYEKVREYKGCMGQKDRKRAVQLSRELEKELDMNNAVNKQFIETCYIQDRLKEKGADCEKEIEELKNVLRYTWSDFDGTIYRVPFREEVVILNQMALCLRRLDKKEAAINIYEQIMDRYEKSIASKDFHLMSAFLIYVNYVVVLEESNCLEDAERVGKEGIELMLKCQRGNIAGKILANLAAVYEKETTKNDAVLAEKCLKYSYVLLKLYKSEYHAKILKNAYKELYSIELD